tara:strand:- start:440 stop:637 length:198 start_codon:yes stop_codon:yes gene_type:complete
MATETIEEFLARGGKVQKSKDAISLDSLLHNEGILDQSEAKKVKTNLSEALDKGLSSQFSTTDSN